MTAVAPAPVGAGAASPDGAGTGPSGFLRRRLHAVTGGAPPMTLVALTALHTFDQFDTAAFGVLAPTIKNEFGLSDAEFSTLVIANLSFVLLLAVPLGSLGDRVPRSKLVVAGGIIAGVFSFLTGVVGTVTLLVLVRLGNGIGQLVNDPVHNSILADAYPVQQRPRVFAAHQNGVYIGAIFGNAVAGAMAALFGWRAAFLVLLIPIIATSLYALRIPEPVRGGSDDPENAAKLVEERGIPLREGARMLWVVPTLKRQYIAWLFIGAGALPLAFVLPLYLDRVFGVPVFIRGLIASANAVCQLAGLLTAARLTQRWLAKDLGEPMRRSGVIFVIVGVGIALTAAAPSVFIAVPLQLATTFAAGMFYAPLLTTQAMVSPARVRTLSFSFGSLFLVVGVWVLWLIPGVAGISDAHGLRWGLAALAPYWLIGGGILASAAGAVAGDTARAARTLAAAAAMQARLRSGDKGPLLSCTGVDVCYGQVQVLFDVDFEVDEGEIVALLGTNGAGKSTLLNAISGIVFPTAGTVLFDGAEITQTDATATVAAGVVYVPGGKGVFPTLTVEENLSLAGWLFKNDPDHVARATEEVLQRFPVLRERWNEKAGNMSGGEQQMLTLGQAFIARPKLLMIDELSLGLAPIVVEQLLDIVRAIHAAGTTIILVEQSVNVAMSLAQRAVFMEKGEIRFDGPTAELLDRPEILRAVFLQGAGAHPTGGTASARASTRRADYVDHCDTCGTSRRPLLETSRLAVSFGGVRAVRSVDLTVREHEIVGIIGPNGAGKTTVFDLLSGYLTPNAGSVTLDGVDVTRHTPHDRATAGLGRSFQDARLFPSMTVRETIAVALERHIDVRDPLSAALVSSAVKRSERVVRARADELIDLMHLGAFADKFVGELSTGSRRVVDLACCMAHDPKVLLLDEPSSGIAQRETEALGPLLLRLRDETGTSLVVIEHDMPLITNLSDTLVALELGAVIASGPPGEVINDPLVIASYLGGDGTGIATQRSGAAPRPPRRSPRRAARLATTAGGGREHGSSP